MFQNRKERRKANKRERRNAFSRYGLLFPANEKQTEKSRLTSILWRSIDWVCSTLLSHFIPPSSLSFAHNSQDASRHSFHKCNKRNREKRRERRGSEDPWEWTPRENSMFFRWRSIITRARTRSISGYFKLLTRRDIPQRAETSSWLSSGKFRTTDRKLIRRARIKTKAECCRQWTRRSETIETRDIRGGSSHYSRAEFYGIACVRRYDRKMFRGKRKERRSTTQHRVIHRLK